MLKTENCLSILQSGCAIGVICQFVPEPEKFRFTVTVLENIVTIGLFSIIATFFFLECKDMILGQAIRQGARQETINEFAKRIDELRKNGQETYEELDNIVKDMRELSTPVLFLTKAPV